jgi:polyribonucleotide nucleotidyltransferase
LVVSTESLSTSRAQLELSDIDMMIGASMDSIAMVEGEMKEISEAEMLEAIKFAHEHIKIKFLLNCVYKLLKERSSYLRRKREDEAIHAKVKPL